MGEGEESAFDVYDARSFVHRTERGQLSLRLPAPTVLVFEYRGYADDGFMDFVEHVWESTLARASHPVQIFADTADQTGYTSGFRLGMIRWSKGMVNRTDTYCLLVKSRWVAMGIAIAKATIGLPAAHAEVTTSRPLFRAKLDAAVRRSLESAAGPALARA
jgi:hypothetical protein